MISASIYTISDQALIGKSQHKTSAVLSRELLLNGFHISTSLTIGEKLENLKEYMELNNNEVYFFLIDESLETFNKFNNFLSDYTNNILVENSYAKDEIFKYYRKTNIPISKQDEYGWMFPKKSRAIINIGGKHHGYILKKETKMFFILPLNYFEAITMIKDTIVPFLNEDISNKYTTSVFKTFGISGNDIKMVIKDIMKNKDKISINIFSSGFESDIILKTKLENKDSITPYAQIVFERLNKFIYAEEDISLYQACFNLLKIKKQTLAIAESITGGNISSEFIKNNRGASEIIKEGIVSYSNNSKIRRLEVDENVIRSHTAVSVQTAYEMATGMLKTSGADIVLATTGYATSSSSDEPLGLCYIAVGDNKEIHVYKNQFDGTREQVIESVTKAAYFYLIKKLRKNDSHFEKTTI